MPKSVADTTAVGKDGIKIDSVQIAETRIDTLNNPQQEYQEYKEPFLDKAYDFIDDDESENAFEFAKFSIGCILDFNYKDFKNDIQKKDGYKGIFFQLKNFCFVLIVLVTFLIAFFSFKENRKVYRLSKLNLILLLITIVCLFLEGLFETFSQIKWGYYAFIITNLLIFYCSKQDKIVNSKS
ncbi:MAG: hypothetical protein QM710_03320 [Flavobacterium sp.]